MKLVLVGANHKTAPLALRERLAVEDATVPLRKLVACQEIDEAVLLSTCNRVEVVALSRSPEAARARLRSFFRRELADGDLGPRIDDHLYEHLGGDAMRHVLRVAASLDSMVLGEPQILGQTKDAYRAAADCGAAGPILARLYQQAFSAAKRVRSETRIAERPISVARVAVDLARRIFEDLADKQALLVGAGEMIETAVQSLRGAGLARVRVANRSPERAEPLAVLCGGTAHGLDDLPRLLPEADLVLSCIGADHHVLTLDMVEPALRARRGRPIFVIDIGVPRNVDPAVDDLDNVYLYDIDDLAAVADDNAGQRQRERARAEAIVEEAKQRFDGWFAALRAVPTIRHLRDRVEVLRAAEVERVLGRVNLPPADRETVEYLTRALVQKILHAPLTALRRSAEREEGMAYLEAARVLFALDDGDDDGEGGGES